MASLTWLRWAVLLVAVLLQLFVYFYPDILNAQGKCDWHNFPKDPLHKQHEINSKYFFIDELPFKDFLLRNFPLLQEPKNTPSPYTSSAVKDIHMLMFGDPQINGNWPTTKYIKRLDNYGNDYYLGHIYSTMSKRLRPSHVAVMGDLFSLQWIYDSEFYNRTLRFTERLFQRPLEYKKNVVETHAKHENYDWEKYMDDEIAMDPSARFQSRLYNDVYDWYNRDSKFPNYENPLFINLTGNHDIGYSGDATWQHMARFHHLFGQNNYVINYNAGTNEQWRLVVVDLLTLEGPALQEEFVSYSWLFLDHLEKYLNPHFNGSTILLTHIPFYKKEGLCRDGPEHRYYVNNEKEPYKNGKLRSQNHLLYETTQKLLDIVFRNKGKEGIILTGHDHEGCDSWYNKEDGVWTASKAKNDTLRASIREVVVRAMMGDFDGQTGVFTGHFDYASNNWQFAFSYCSFTIQHWWWASKVSAFLSILLHSAGILFGF